MARITKVLPFLLIFIAKFVKSEDPTLVDCMEKPQHVSDLSYPTALTYFQNCLNLGRNTPRDALPAGYFNKVMDNMRTSFDDFLGFSGLDEEQLTSIRKEIRRLTIGVRHMPRKKISKPVAQNYSRNAKDLEALQDKSDKNATGSDLSEHSVHLEFINNIWPQRPFFPDDQTVSVDEAEGDVNESVQNSLKRCCRRRKKCFNKVEILTLIVSILILALCMWMAYRMYCQYMLWSRVCCESKDESTPLRDSDETEDDGRRKSSKLRRGYLEDD